jgi:integrase
MIVAAGHNKWRIRIDVRDPLTGVRHRPGETFYGTWNQAKVREEDMKVAARRGEITAADCDPQCFGDWLDVYLEDWANVSEQTREQYQLYARVHLKPALGHIRLTELNAVHLQRYYRKKLETLKPRSVHHHKEVVHSSLSKALELKLIHENVDTAARFKVPQTTACKALLDEQGFQQFMDAALETQLYPIVVLGATTGLRRGEICGLRWSDLDLAGATLSVSQVAVYTKKRGVFFKEPKTQRSRRTIPIFPETVERLKAWKVRQDEKRLKLGPDYKDHDLVCARADGRPHNPGSVTSQYRDWRDCRKLAPARLHDLRHSFATHLLNKGVPMQVVSRYLGHSSFAVTDAVYFHLTVDETRKALEAAGAFAKQGEVVELSAARQAEQRD